MAFSILTEGASTTPNSTAITLPRVKLYFTGKSNLLIFNARHQGSWVTLCDALYGVVFDARLMTFENRDNRTNLEKTIQSIASLDHAC